MSMPPYSRPLLHSVSSLPSHLGCQCADRGRSLSSGLMGGRYPDGCGWYLRAIIARSQ